MTLRQYEAFLKTVECASVSAAAQALGVSQSALTQLLAGLERDCGFPLLVRNRGGVHLTPAGKALLPAVQHYCFLPFCSPFQTGRSHYTTFFECV